MQQQFPDLFMFFAVTGVLWWSWMIIKVMDVIGIGWARKNNKLYYSSLQQKHYDFRLHKIKSKGLFPTINEIDAKPTYIKRNTDSENKATQAELDTKPKWERTNAEEEEKADNTGCIRDSAD